MEELTAVTANAALVLVLRRGRDAVEGLKAAWAHTGERLSTVSARRRLRAKGLLDLWTGAAEFENRADISLVEGVGED